MKTIISLALRLPNVPLQLKHFWFLMAWKFLFFMGTPKKRVFQADPPRSISDLKHRIVDEIVVIQHNYCDRS